MAKNLIQNGSRMTWTNGTGSDVSSGDLVPVGASFGVALTDIANGAKGALAMEGVYELPAISTAAISQGTPVYFEVASKKCSPTAEDQKFIGLAWATKEEAGASVLVKLGTGYHPVVNNEA